ncbi:MAG: sulfatase [Opitutales bacterium]|nr:sulfatase [Opitutales bacterium]MDP4884092.1 sulfatase [Opitutales bacterium]
MKPHHFPKKLTAIAAACLVVAHAVTAADRPNILFLFSDDHAPQSISAYGSKINQTPNIDRLADEGIIFRNSFCANSICAPSRANILTGKHSHLNGQRDNRDTFDGSQVTFPQILQAAGYHTAIFGKWHLRSDPTGFDEWMVYPGQGHYYNPDYRTPEGTKRITGYSVDVTAGLALDFLKRRPTDQPFMLMCQFKAPHRQWLPGPKYHHLYADEEIPEPETLFDDYQGRTSSAAKHEMGIDEHMVMTFDLMVPSEGTFDWKRMNAAQKELWKSTYDARNKATQPENLTGKELVRWKYQRYIKDYLRCVAAVDENIGHILDYLSESGLDKNTIVIYSSDQGFYLGEHGWFDKRWMYEESLRMPLIMRWPGTIQPGSEVTELVQNIDYAPTLIEIANAAVPGEIQGKSLLPFLKNEPADDWRDSIYYHYYEHGFHGVPRHEGVRNARYKLIHFYHTNEWELFDLEKDPSEMKSQFDNPEYAEVRKNLEIELQRLRQNYDVTEPVSMLNSSRAPRSVK